MMMMGWGWGLLNTIFWILIVGIVIYAVLQLIVKPFEKKEDPALAILREKFANGEINEEEFAQRKSFLKQN
jgi:putative membrane protein